MESLKEYIQNMQEAFINALRQLEDNQMSVLTSVLAFAGATTLPTNQPPTTQPSLTPPTTQPSLTPLTTQPPLQLTQPLPLTTQPSLQLTQPLPPLAPPTQPLLPLTQPLPLTTQPLLPLTQPLPPLALPPTQLLLPTTLPSSSAHASLDSYDSMPATPMPSLTEDDVIHWIS